MADEHDQSKGTAGAEGAGHAALAQPAIITQLPREILQMIFAYLMFDDLPTWKEWFQYSQETRYNPAPPYMRDPPDKTDIKNLRLTCRAFESLASSLLFRKVRLSYYRADLHNFVRVAFSPALRLHVKVLYWEDTMAAVVFDNHPEQVRTRAAIGYTSASIARNATHQSLLSKAWEQLCWNQGLSRPEGPVRPAAHTAEDGEGGNDLGVAGVLYGPREKSPVDGVVSLLEAALRNLENLGRVTSLPMRDLGGSPATRGRYRGKHIPSILPGEFAETDILEPLHDRFFNLHQIVFLLERPRPDFFNDGFFRYIAPALNKVGTSHENLHSLYLVDERCAVGPAAGRELGCVRRFPEIHPGAFGNITDLKLILPFYAQYHTSSPDRDAHHWYRAMRRCIESATQLQTLTLSEAISPFAPFRNAGDLEPWTRTGHFFDLLVWGDQAEGGGPGVHGRPHTHSPPGRRWNHLKSLAVEGLYFSQLSLLRLLATHARTITKLHVLMSPFEFRTARVLSKIPLLTLKDLRITPPFWAADAIPRAIDVAVQDQNKPPHFYARDVEYIPGDKLKTYINDYKPSRGGDLVSEASKWSVLELPLPLPLADQDTLSFMFGSLYQQPPSPNYSTANFFIRTRPCRLKVRGWFIDWEDDIAAGTLTQGRIRELEHDRHRVWYNRDSPEDKECWERVRAQERRAFDFRDWIPREEDQKHHPSFVGQQAGTTTNVDGDDDNDDDGLGNAEDASVSDGTTSTAGSSTSRGRELIVSPREFGRFTKEELKCVFFGLGWSSKEDNGNPLHEDDRGKVEKTRGQGDGDTAGSLPVSVPLVSASTSSQEITTTTHTGGDYNGDMPEVFREEADTLCRVLRLPGDVDEGVRSLWREIRRPVRDESPG